MSEENEGGSNTKKSKPLAFEPFSKSQVDIIIPFHGQYEKVSKLIQSILISVKSNPYQITLVDDCSPNKNFSQEIKDQFIKNTPNIFRPQVNCIRSEKHIGFGGALKLGYQSTNLSWVLFIHSDCVVEDPNFMIEMGKSLLNWKEQNIPVKMVSARTNNPGDCKLAKADKNQKDTKDIILEKGALPLFCAMCHRDLFEYIDGFIKPYPYAWYEDEELAFRMKQYGFYQGISTKSWIYHEGGATINYVMKNYPDAKETMDKNRSVCINDIKKLS
jgi:GT2 family glycosyltransferase